MNELQFGFGLILFLIILVVWSVIWKGMALWKSARRGDTGWFVFFLLFNSAGILEIIYIFLIAKNKKD